MNEIREPLPASKKGEHSILKDVSSRLQDADRLVTQIIRAMESGESAESDFTLAALCGVSATINTNIIMVERIRALPTGGKVKV